MTRYFTIFLLLKLLLALESSHISENSALDIVQVILLRRPQLLRTRSQKAGFKACATKSLMMTVSTKSHCRKGVVKAIGELTRNYFSSKASDQR
jgi:hypothetical protein